MERRNLYEMLGVARTASEGDIRKAYRRVARENHPDRNPGDRLAEERFKDASYARGILLNSEKRALYDEFGEVGLRDGFDPRSYRKQRNPPSRASQPGFRAPSSPPRPSGPPAQDIFPESRRREKREAENGKSGWSGTFHDFIQGDVVDSIFGRKREKKKRDLVSDIEVGFTEAIVGVEKEIGFETPEGGEKVLRARIPAGVADGQRVRLRGQGAAGGDLVLTVRVGTHPYFRRQDQDLLLTLPVTIGEAFHGAQVPVPTPAGQAVVSIPSRVQSGVKLRLRGYGVRRGDQTGDLIVTVQIRLPEAADEEAARLVDQLELAYQTDPRAGLDL